MMHDLTAVPGASGFVQVSPRLKWTQELSLLAMIAFFIAFFLVLIGSPVFSFFAAGADVSRCPLTRAGKGGLGVHLSGNWLQFCRWISSMSCLVSMDGLSWVLPTTTR